jgi:hypothetical protein
MVGKVVKISDHKPDTNDVSSHSAVIQEGTSLRTFAHLFLKLYGELDKN